MKVKNSVYLLALLLGLGLGVLAQTGTTDDETLWKKLDWNPDDVLDGKELEGGWVRFDTNGDNEVTKTEFLVGRAKERGTTIRPVGIRPTVKPAPAPAPSVAPRPAAPPRATALPRVSPRAGQIVGAIGAAGGARLGRVSIAVSGFEDGKLASTFGNGALAETVNKTIPIAGSTYAIPVPPGAYRATAYSTHSFQGGTYHFPLELVTEPKFDYNGLGLEKLRGGLVRSFVLKLTGPKKGETTGTKGYTETTYRYAFHGGRIDFYAGSFEGGVRPLRDAYPPESRVLVSLNPVALVDGSVVRPFLVDLPLGDDGKWSFIQRGVVPGTYTATARLRTPDGNERPLRVETTTGSYEFPTRWQTSKTFTFKPSTLGPEPRMGVDSIRFYVAE